MASVTVSASCVVYGNGTNFTVTLPLNNPNPIATPVQTQATVNGGSGVNVTVPTGVTNGVWIIPPSGSSVQKTYKGVTGDTGIGGATGNSASWAFLPVIGGAVFNIAANGVETLTLVYD